jgi:hypothetical protein
LLDFPTNFLLHNSANPFSTNFFVPDSSHQQKPSNSDGESSPRSSWSDQSNPHFLISHLNLHFSEQSTPPSSSDHHHHLGIGARKLASSTSPLSDLSAQTVPGNAQKQREDAEEGEEADEDQKKALDLTMNGRRGSASDGHIEAVGLLKIKEQSQTTQMPAGGGAQFGPPSSTIEQLLLGPLAGRNALYSANAFLNLLQQKGTGQMVFSGKVD